MYSKLDPIPYLEYMENDWDSAEDISDNKKVRRQISDWCEYDSDFKGFVSDSKSNHKISPDEHASNGKELKENFSQSYYKNILNHLQSEGSDEKMSRSSIKGKMKDTCGLPNPTLENYIRGGKTMKEKKDSFLKVEEFRKSKQFRESKIPTNTSFSGIDKNQIQHLGAMNYETRK